MESIPCIGREQINDAPHKANLNSWPEHECRQLHKPRSKSCRDTDSVIKDNTASSQVSGAATLAKRRKQYHKTFPKSAVATTAMRWLALTRHPSARGSNKEKACRLYYPSRLFSLMLAPVSRPSGPVLSLIPAPPGLCNKANGIS